MRVPVAIRCLVVAAVSIAAADWQGGAAVAAETPSIDALIAQVENRSCTYSSDPSEIYERSSRGASWLGALLFRSWNKYRCVLGAARCLAKLGPAGTPAVPALVRALRDGPNDYDTGDGVIATRSAIASALGAIGDPRAIDPLAEALGAARPHDRSWSALARSEPAAVRAIVEALGRFGPQAARHWEQIARVLASRNTDTGCFEARRQAFERSEAIDLAAREIQARAGTGSGPYVVPWEAVDAARNRLDRTSPEYVRDLEARAQDGVAAAAADALGKLQVKAATTVLRETLSNRCAAAAAARALAALGASDPETIEQLERILGDRNLGPATRSAAARALGALGAARSVGVLAATLLEPAVRQASCEALGAMGADGALGVIGAGRNRRGTLTCGPQRARDPLFHRGGSTSVGPSRSGAGARAYRRRPGR